jgi:hypothetical protein
MPFIIGFLKAFFGVLFGRLTVFVSSFVAAFVIPFTYSVYRLFSKAGKIAIVVGVILGFISLFALAVDQAFSLLGSAVPHVFLEVGRMLLPDNLSLCISVLLFLRLKSLVFFWAVRISEKFERS